MANKKLFIAGHNGMLGRAIPIRLPKILKFFRDVHSVGVEPTTDGFEIRHSIQLNYECVFTYSIYIGFCVIFLGKIFYFIF